MLSGCKQPRHRAAAGVAADDDVRHLELDDGELDRGRDAAHEAVVLRHDVAGVAEHEQLAGLGLHQEKRIDPRVAAGDDHRVRRLAGGELGEALAVLRVHVALKGANAGDDVVHVPQS